MKRFIDIAIPMDACNLKCHYCYIGQHKNADNASKEANIIKRALKKTFLYRLYKKIKYPPPAAEKKIYKYSAEHIGKALAQERLGGVCLVNMCANGETLIPAEIIEITRQILLQGHYVWIVTNGLLTKRFEQLFEMPEELLNRLGFKLSFHWLELVRISQLDLFTHNLELIKKAGCSFSVEITPCDELKPHIEEIIAHSLKYFGAKPHVTIPRNLADENITLLSKHTLPKFHEIWGAFESDLLDFKCSVWGQKRKEYCHAGEWSGYLHAGSGDMFQCYTTTTTNIFEDITKPIKFNAVGCDCPTPHCFNGHSFLSLGNIPEIKTHTYAQLRNRVCPDGSEWLNKDMKEFISRRLEDYNIKSEKYMHISLDDVINILADINKNAKKYKSIFDNAILKYLKNLNIKYGAVFSLYVYYETEGFNLSGMTEKFKVEFASNSSWLKFGFHGLNGGVNYAETSAEKAKRDYDMTIKEIIRIAGVDCIDRVLRLHYFAGNLESVNAMSKADFGLAGLLGPDDGRQSYYLEKNPAGKYIDENNNIMFLPTDLRLESEDNISGDLFNKNELIVFTHEWQMDNKYIRDKMEKCCELAVKHGYRFDFVI